MKPLFYLRTRDSQYVTASGRGLTFARERAGFWHETDLLAIRKRIPPMWDVREQVVRESA